MKKSLWLTHLAALVALSGGYVLANPFNAPSPDDESSATETTAQETRETSEVAFQQSQPPVLPEVEVRPDATPTPGLARDDNPFDLPGTYPSLADQLFEDLDNGASRGIPKSLFDVPSNSTIVDRGTIREKQAATIVQSLQYENSVLVQQTGRGQASLFIRGLTGQQVLLMVDGVRVNNSVLRAGPNQYAALFDPGSIDHIEVVRGSQSVMWGGDALGGAVNFVTRGADPNRGNYGGTSFTQYLSSADDGSYSRGNIEGWVGNSGIFSGGSFLDNDDLDRGGGLRPQPGTKYSQYAGDIKYNYIISDDDLLTVTLQHFEQMDVPRSDRFAPFAQQNNITESNPVRPTFFDQQRDLAYIRLQGNGYNAFFDAYSQTFSYQRNKEGNRELQGTQLTVGEFDVGTFGYTMTFMKDFEQFGAISYGGDYYYDDIDSVRVRRANPNAAFVNVPSAQYPDDARYDRAGGFVLWDLQLTERLNLISGGRYEHVTAAGTPLVTQDNVANTPFPFENSYEDWIGSIGYVYNIDQNWNFVGGVYEGFRAPSIDDLTADKTFQQNGVNTPSIGALNVQPEHSTTYEVGLKLDAPRLRGQLFQWYMNIDDYMTRTPDANNRVVLGNSDARLHGTELSGEFLLDAQWSVYGNVFYTWGRDVVKNEPFPRVPPTQGVAGLRWRAEDRLTYLDTFTWMVADYDRNQYPSSLIDTTGPDTGKVTDARFPNNGQPGFATLNMRMGWTFGQNNNHTLSLSLLNMTDKYYRVIGSGVDGEGFNAILGYEFRQ